MSTLIIREAAREDYDPARDILVAAFRPVKELYRPKKEAAPDTFSYERLVAALDSQLVGTVDYRFEDDRLHLKALAIHPDQQRRGIARRLLAHLEKLARSRGKRYLSLWTVLESGNRDVFRSLGFTTEHQEESPVLEAPDGRPVTEIFMKRAIDCKGQSEST